MSTVLDELYYGNINPFESIYPKDKEYRDINKKTTDEMDLWRKKLTTEDFSRLENLCDLIAQSCGIELCETFGYGFKLGASLMIEIFSGSDGPAYRQNV